MDYTLKTLLFPIAIQYTGAHIKFINRLNFDIPGALKNL